MSAPAMAKPYDQVLDAQKHYRTLLQCTARPGTIGQLDDVSMEIPAPLNRATALIAFTLLSADSSFYLPQGDNSAMDLLRRETLAKPVPAEQADFLLIPDARRCEEIDCARQGTLAYPEQGATVVLQVTALSPAPMPGCLRLTLTGPGIESETVVFVLGAPAALFESLQKRNAEFPLGVDAFLTCDSLSAGPCAVALPRTTRVQWEPVSEWS
jgi:alpha-D-ribose 1-methylphosphonate 5-triphosphate synthase subunit PhnH